MTPEELEKALRNLSLLLVQRMLEHPEYSVMLAIASAQAAIVRTVLCQTKEELTDGLEILALSLRKISPGIQFMESDVN